MKNFNYENDIINLHFEKFAGIEDENLRNHFFRIRENFINANFSYGKDFLINQNFDLVEILNASNDNDFPFKLKEHFTRNEILFMLASVFAGKGIQIR